MKKKTLLFFVLLAVCGVNGFSQALFSPDVYKKIIQNVFEVVVLKPQEAVLTYEKALPLQFIPFSIRNDKYIPIGTAFLLKDSYFYSAAHVFNIAEDSLYKDYFLRDSKGNIFKVDTLTKFSLARDFVVFTAEDFTIEPNQGLDLQAKSEINTEVFSAGNALGDGIVIRNGILTSQTYENENGEWKWLRFSAAASPGNSGGPLVNNQGEVLGIITMKSQNENLNYALPISEIAAVPPNTGIIHRLIAYNLPNILKEQENGSFDYKIALPKNYKTVQNECSSAYKKFTLELISALKAKYGLTAEGGFTKARGSLELMYDYFLPSFPATIVLSDNKEWNLYSPKDVQEFKLPNTGSVSYGEMLGISMAMIAKPDTVPYSEFISSPKLYMDYLLSASRMYRYIGSDRVAITSYGAPAKTETHQDSFGRTWFVNYWELDFTDVMVVSYALPVPSGVYIMSKMAATSSILNGFNFDIEFLTDFVYNGYNANVKQWKDFFALDKKTYPLYEPFASMTFTASSSEITVTTREFSQTIPESLMKTDDETNIAFGLGYCYDNADFMQEVRYFTIFPKSRKDDYKSISIHKNRKPPEAEQGDLSDVWEDQYNKNYPYTAKPYEQNDYTYYKEIFVDKLDEQRTSLFGLTLIVYGKSKEQEMLEFATEVKKRLTVLTAP